LAATPHAFHVRSLSTAEILDEGFRMFRHGFGRFLVFQLIVYVPTTLLLAYGILASGDVLTEMVNKSSAPEVAPLIPKLLLFLSALLGLQVVAGAVVMVATSRAVADSYLGRAWSTLSILREALRLAPASIGVGAVLTAIFLIAVFVPMTIGIGVAVAVVATSGSDMLLVALSVLFGIALGMLAVCAAFLLVLRYGLALVALAVEHVSVRAALARSVELMRGRYLRALVLFLILVAVNLLITAVLSMWLPTPKFEGMDPDELRRLVPQIIRGQLLSTVLSQVAGIFVQVYTLICWTLFYFTARCEAEAFDLSHLAERTAEA
jgi:hypothetical protein